MFLSEPNLLTHVTEVAAGSTAVLRCNSNDDKHNFMFWQLGQNKVIGPDNNDFDQSKYKYEVLSGKLLIKAVTPDERGYYRCISKNLNSGGLNIGAVEMIVIKKDGGGVPIDTDSDVETIKIILIVISLIILIVCAIFFYRMRKDEKKRTTTRLAMFGDEDDEEGSGEEIYNRTTTLINNSSPTPSTSKQPKDHITGIDNRGLDTDFNAAFQQIAIDVSNRNLI